MIRELRGATSLANQKLSAERQRLTLTVTKVPFRLLNKSMAIDGLSSLAESALGLFPLVDKGGKEPVSGGKAVGEADPLALSRGLDELLLPADAVADAALPEPLDRFHGLVAAGAALGLAVAGAAGELVDMIATESKGVRSKLLFAPE